MSTVAALKTERASFVKEGDYLGPAHVVSASGRELSLELPSGQAVAATLAVAFPYEAQTGDVLLVIARGESYYGIGVLHGTGRTQLTFHGDVELRSEGGAVRISGEKGVAIEGPELDVRVGAVRLLADTLTQRVASIYQRVTSLLSVHARESHTSIDESSFTKAKSAAILTEETMSINGKQIHLG
ncbi:MAG: DUF3540 domain-containing protein [Byssovorax sp.]